MTEADYLMHYGVLGMKWGHRNAETLARYARRGSGRAVTIGEKAIGKISDTGGHIRTKAYSAAHKHRVAIARGNPTHYNIEKALNSSAKREAKIRRDAKNVEARARSARSIERTKVLQAKAERKLERADKQRDYQQYVIDKYGSTSMKIVETEGSMGYVDKRKVRDKVIESAVKTGVGTIASGGTLAIPLATMETAAVVAAWSAKEQIPRKRYEVLTKTDFNEVVDNLDDEGLSLKKRDGRYV